MPFSTKQSDVFYNDQTKEMFVCTVSAITAARCTDGETLYGSLPIIYKIDNPDVIDFDASYEAQNGSIGTEQEVIEFDWSGE